MVLLLRIIFLHISLSSKHKKIFIKTTYRFKITSFKHKAEQETFSQHISPDE